MDTGIIRFIGSILGLLSGLYGDKGKENGNYYMGFMGLL